MSTFICPHCQQQTVLSATARLNMESYGGHCLVKTACCGMGVNVRPILTFDVSPYYGEKESDDWGNTFTVVQQPIDRTLS